MLVNLYFSVILLLGNNNAVIKDTTIIGKAENAKYGAMVVSSDGQAHYYVDGLTAWADSVLGKTVEITGKMKVKKFRQPKEGEPEKGGIVGPIRILLNPRWKIISASF